MKNKDTAVIVGFSLVLTDSGKGYAELCTEVVDTDAKELISFLEEEDWVVVNAAINAIKRISSKVQREIHNEINAVRSV